MAKLSKLKISVIPMAIVLATCSILAAAYYTQKSESIEYTPTVNKAPNFNLINQNNEKVSLSQFRDSVKVLSFMYVRCSMPNMCPLKTKKYRRLQKSLGDKWGKNTVLLSITFDPESDSPGMLKKYGELYEADFTNWHFLTESKEVIEKVCSDYMIIHEKQENEGLVDGVIRHSVMTFLIDQNNNIREMYIGNKWDPEDVKEAVISLLERGALKR